MIEDMKLKSDKIEQKLMENLEFLKMNSIEMTRIIRKKKSPKRDHSSDSTMNTSNAYHCF